MTRSIVLALFLSLLPSASAETDSTVEITTKLTNEIMAQGTAYSNLAELLKGGPRLSGTPGAAKAVAWAEAKMKSIGFDQVFLQPVTVPAWERGKVERARVTSRQGGKLKVVALGNSVGTPKGGIEAEVVEVKTFEEVDALGEKLKGKIVFYNRPMDPTFSSTFKAYGGAVNQRSSGASRASKVGALAVLVRSMTLVQDGHPHTGGLWYADGVAKIPAAAVTTEDANRLSAMLKQGPVKVRLELSAKQLPEAKSFNVIGQINGSEKPEEFVLVGGHLDSWDLSPGAHDNGAGVVMSLEVARAIKAVGIKPKRSIRVVLFMAEEFGGIGGKEYAKQAKLKNEKHIAALESDRGGFAPRGFSVPKSDSAAERVKSWGKYLAPIHADLVLRDFAGTDVEPLEEQGTVLMGYVPDSQRYFDFHHSDYDDLSAVNARELHLGASSMAILVHLLADRGL